MGLYLDPKPVPTLLEGMGVCLIVYIDDMLILAETRKKTKEHPEALIYLLQCLSFVINQNKSVHMAAQRMDFLDFTVDTVRVLMQI